MSTGNARQLTHQHKLVEEVAFESAIAPELAASVEVLVADTERATREGCALVLRSLGFTVTVVGARDEALALVTRRRFDLLLIDAALQPGAGSDVMRAALATYPESIVIITTLTPSVPASLESLRAGAWDYVPKPFTAVHLEILAGRAMHDVLAGRGRPHPTDHEADASEEGLFGRSAAIRAALDLARRVAPTNSPVLLVSESGTGKGKLARLIHARSSRARNVFLVVNCSVVTSEELFGRLASRGETRHDEPGLLEAAAGGTVFLTDLDDLPSPLAEQLLRVIEKGGLPRARFSAPAKSLNVRFIASLRNAPGGAARSGKVWRELMRQLGKMPIRLSALRERPTDIPLVADHLLKCCWVQHHDSAPLPRLTPATCAWMQTLPWPGNVRQLWRVMERLSLISEPGTDIEPTDIPMISDVSEEAGGGVYAAILDDVYSSAKEKLIEQFELDYLPRLVNRAQGNMARAARMAEVDRKTLYRLMDKHGLRRGGLERELG